MGNYTAILHGKKMRIILAIVGYNQPNFNTLALQHFLSNSTIAAWC